MYECVGERAWPLLYHGRVARQYDIGNYIVRLHSYILLFLKEM